MSYQYKGDSFGTSPDLKYHEYVFDSMDNNGSYNPASVLATDWPIFIMERPLLDIAAVKIIEVQIPFSYYVFSRENNTFILSETLSHTITIPEGNYNGSTMSTQLQTLLNDASVFGSSTYTVTFSLITGKLVISSPHSFSFRFGTGSNDDGSSNPRLWLGFDAYFTAATLQGSAWVLTSQNVALLTGPNYLYLNSESLGTLCQLYLPEASPLAQGGIGPQMAKISVNTSPGGVIDWQDPDNQKYFDLENLSSLQNIDFYLTLGNQLVQKPLRLNGQGFSLKMGITQNSNQRNTNQQGTAAQGRVVKRIRAV